MTEAKAAEKKKPPSFRPSKGKVIFVFFTLVLFLAAATALFVIGFGYKRKFGEMVRKENARIKTQPLMEFARDNLERAERLSLMSGVDVADVRELCENTISAASKAAGLRPDLADAFYVRGRALELQYQFEEAEADYTETLKIYPYHAHAFLRRGLVGLRKYARALLLGPASKGLQATADRAGEDLRHSVFYSTGDTQDERNRMVANPMGLAFLVGDHKDVPTHADTAAGFDPTEWLCPYVKGLSLVALNNFEEALKAFEAACAISPYAADAHAYRAFVLRSLKRPPEAIEALNAALQRDDQFFEAVFVRGHVLLDARRFEEARVDFQLCLKIRPSLSEARLRGAIAGLEWWIRSGRADGDLIAAVVAELDLFLQENPANDEGRLARARALLETGRARDALSDADAILSRAADRADALSVRARIHVALKNWDAADADLTKLGNLRERARVRALAGRIDDAVKDIDQLLQKDANDAGLHLEKARILLDGGRVDDALAALDKLSEIAPKLPRGKMLRAEALLAKKDAAGAVKLATEAFESDTQLGEALIVRGKAHLALGNKAAAEEDFKKAVEINPALQDRVPKY